MRGYSIGLVLTGNEVEDIERRNNLEDFYDIFENDDHEFEDCICYGGLDDFFFCRFTEDKPRSLFGEFVAIPALKIPDPFKAAYSGPDEIQKEMEISFGRYLPDDFNWNTHLGYFLHIMRD